MKQNFKLTKDQQTLVEKNLSIVHWVIVNNIHVNPGICGLEYGDLFQEGCLWLCKAAFTYHAGQAQFSTYAKSVARQSPRERNRLLACKNFAFTHANVHKHCRHFRRG